MSDFIPTHLHIKSGDLYRVITRGHMGANYPATAVVVYDDEQGRVFVRPAAEFDDGRFAALAGHSPDTGKLVQTEPPADLVDAIAATIRRVSSVSGGTYQEQACAVVALFAEREKAAAELLRAAAPFADLIGAWSRDVRFCPEPHDAAIEHTGQTPAWVTAQECNALINAINAAKDAGLGVRHGQD